MSSYKKYAFTPTLTAIALHDFTPHAELFHYDMNAPAATDIADKNQVLSHLHLSACEQQPTHPRIKTYVITHTITLPSQPFNATRQESRMLTPKDHDGAPKNHIRAAQVNAESTHLASQDVWLLTQHDRALVKGGLRISLTTIESALIKKMLHHEERVVSKEELIRNIGREPELYRGLEMCLSRLQEKFKRVNDGERLFRAVRNRGYCLTQKIKKPLETTQPRR